jgi:hypothetical protein
VLYARIAPSGQICWPSSSCSAKPLPGATSPARVQRIGRSSRVVLLRACSLRQGPPPTLASVGPRIYSSWNTSLTEELTGPVEQVRVLLL